MRQFRFNLFHGKNDIIPYRVVSVLALDIEEAVHKLNTIDNAWLRADPY